MIITGAHADAGDSVRVAAAAATVQPDNAPLARRLVSRRVSVVVQLENVSAPALPAAPSAPLQPPFFSMRVLKRLVQSRVVVVPVALVCYALNWINLTLVREAIMEAAAGRNAGNATFVRNRYDGGSDVLAAMVATRIWWEALVCFLKVPVLGLLYLRRKPAMVVIEVTIWLLVYLGFRHRWGLNPLWAWILALWLSSTYAGWRYMGKSFLRASKSAAISVSIIWTFLIVAAAYFAVTTRDDPDPVAIVLTTGVAYPLLAAVLKFLAMGSLLRHQGDTLNEGLFQDAARAAEITLSIPCLVAIMQIESVSAFAIATILAFVFKCTGTLALVLLYTPRAFKIEEAAIDTFSTSLRSIHGSSNMRSARRSTVERLDALDQHKARLAVRIANEEWAESLVVVTAAQLAYVVTPRLGSLSVVLLVIRTLILIPLQLVKDTIKGALCHRFGVPVGQVEVVMDRWSVSVCVAIHVIISWVLSLGAVLYKYV